MNEWITNIDSKTLMHIMCQKYFLNKIKEVIGETKRIFNRSSANYYHEFCIEIDENLPEKVDELIKNKLLENGFFNYIKISFFISSTNISRNSLDLVIRIEFKENLTQNDIKSINGLLLLLGYGDEL